MLRQEDLAEGQARAQQALQAAEVNGDRSVAALALFELGWIARVTGKGQDARQLLEQSCAAARTAGDRFWHAASVEHLGILALYEGELDRGQALLESSVGLHRDAGHTWGLAGGLLALGALKTAQRDFEAARATLAESVDVYRDLGDQLGLASCLDALGTLWEGRGRPGRCRTSIWRRRITTRERGRRGELEPGTAARGSPSEGSSLPSANMASRRPGQQDGSSSVHDAIAAAFAETPAEEAVPSTASAGEAAGADDTRAPGSSPRAARLE